MTIEEIDLEKDLSPQEREFIRIVYHEQVKDWFCDGIVFPLTYCISLICLMRFVGMLL
jgi:hypothetical protein